MFTPSLEHVRNFTDAFVNIHQKFADTIQLVIEDI
jgi:hypothetical protein